MQDRRSVKLLLHSGRGEFLVLKRRNVGIAGQEFLPDLPGGEVKFGEQDTPALDRLLAEQTGLVLNTEDAVEIGFDAEYEPGEGMMTRVLYLLKIETVRPMIRLDDSYEGFDWVSHEEMGGFEPPLQVLVRTALDFYM